MPARVVAAAAALLVAASPALARESGERGRVLIVSFAGQLPGALAGAPRRLTRAMADVVRDAGSRVTRAPLADILAVGGCAEATDDCLQQALALLEVRRMVLGEVEPAGSGKVRVRLRLIAAARRPRSQSFVIAGDAPDLESAFRARATAFWRDPTRAVDAVDAAGAARVSAAGAAASAGAPPRPELTAEERPGAGFSARRVDPVAWGVAGGGAGLVLAGGLLLLSAAHKQDQVDRAPTDSVADLEELVELEDTARAHANWGGALLVIGAVAAAAGTALVIKQGNDQRADGDPRAGALTLSPSLGPGGVGAVLTLRAAR